ncbi:MAG TPA: DUF3084 domain-containing protein [Candidatus Avacidaminococcus intestinavium]|uniref:DUF3084 domain-containing protein n=1 Tax=Candidatus Avacidaminococcus intestinavium TaxID=2840684 RepID=A0A9D1MNH7_9FIRM|nr:DUF3084 domain-containing protein [Candidatus Avacidaminococcus intestinavium]
MFGVTLILILAVMGGAIAFIGDKLGSKIGKKRLSVFGLRPYHTSVLMTIITGILIATVTLAVLAVASKDARTALFGMDQLKQELITLSQDRENAQQELIDKNEVITSLDNQIKVGTEKLVDLQKERDALDEQLTSLQQKYAQAGVELSEMRSEVVELEAARDKLNQEITDLEEETERLRAGLIAIREGDVVFRAGEVISAGILKAGLTDVENDNQMDAFLAGANQEVRERMGIEATDLQFIWLPEVLVENAKQVLNKNKGTMFVRVIAAGNIIKGERAVAGLELIPNKIVYEKNAKIVTEEVNVASDGRNINAILLNFLAQINKKAVMDGVIPDPLTGRVGNVDAATMIEITEKMEALGGKLELTAYAKDDINVAGPVIVRLEVHKGEY